MDIDDIVAIVVFAALFGVLAMMASRRRRGRGQGLPLVIGFVVLLVLVMGVLAEEAI